jgi:hypothetical protein
MTEAKLMTIKRAAVVAEAGTLLLLMWWSVWGSKPPQVGGDKESRRVVDALYTAFTSKNTSRLDKCEAQLHALRDNGKLPRLAADHLDGLIKTARGGNWHRATHKLFDFMKAQRRAGALAESKTSIRNPDILQGRAICPQ